MKYDRLISLDTMISDLEIMEVAYGSNYPVKTRANGHFRKSKICFISNNIKDLPSHKGAYSAGYLYYLKEVDTIGGLVNTLKLARSEGYQLNRERGRTGLSSGCIVLYGDISLQKDCKSKE